MKKITLLLALVILTVPLFSCSSYSGEKELYEAGIEVAKTMKQMMKSDEYAEIYGIGNMDEVRTFVDSIDMSGLDDPDTVYSVVLPEAEKLYGEIFADKEDWDDLDDVIRTQLEHRMGFPAIISLINSQNSGSSAIVAASSYMAIVKNEELSLEAPVTYIYVYESGTVIAVMFAENGTAQGQFIFTKDPQDIDELFEDFDCEVERLDIK